MKKYFSRVFTALSVLLNVLLGGQNNQTFSARNHEWKRQGKFNLEKVIDYFLGHGHCNECWSYWKIRKDW